MVDKKTDLEQLKGILEQFDQKTIQQAVEGLLEGAPCRKSYKDFDDPGPEVRVGSESHVTLEEIAYLERIIQESNLLPVHFLEEGAVVQRAVARVTKDGSGWGTGFLVSPSLFMTNNHVIPNEAFALRCAMQFNFQLDYMGNPQTVDAYTPDPDDVFYTNSSLDFTLIRLNPHCHPVYIKVRDLWRTRIGGEAEEDVLERLTLMQPVAAAQPLLRDRLLRMVCIAAGGSWGYLRLPSSITYAVGEHLNIVQHPQARRKEVALQKNNITNIYTNRIRYTTDTEPGSSGSPVFNNQWDLVVIHHAAGEWDSAAGEWLSNEGMRMDKIVADLRSHYGGTPTGDQILTELGI